MVVVMVDVVVFNLLGVYSVVTLARGGGGANRLSFGSLVFFEYE